MTTTKIIGEKIAMINDEEILLVDALEARELESKGYKRMDVKGRRIFVGVVADKLDSIEDF